MPSVVNVYPYAAVALLLAVRVCSGGFFSEIEVLSDPEVNGQKDYTVRFHPVESHTCDEVVFECIYAQEIPWTEADGKKSVKIHEPVRFAYRRAGAKFVNDLDHYISFRVPVAFSRLERMYGEGVFKAEYPVVIRRMRISGSASARTSLVRSRPLKKMPIMFSKKIKPEVRSGKRSSLAA